MNNRLRTPLASSGLRTSRRQFLGRTLAAAALPAVVSSSALGLDGTVAPSNRVTLGCIGMGIQGMGDMRAFRGNPEVHVRAVCDVHETQRLLAKNSVDDGYDNTDCATCRDFRELMARKDIDAVQISAPDHWHTLMVLEAARQGKHIFCEKPLGWSFRAAKAAQKAVQRSGVVFQFGTQQRSMGKFRVACELVRNGMIGRLQTILVGVPGSWTFPKQPTEPVPKELDYDLWLGPAPLAPYCYQRCRPWTEGQGRGGYSIWYCISDYCMGMIGNWGVHYLDVAQWGNASDLSGPAEVEGTAVFPQGLLTDCSVSWQVTNRYANGVTLVHMDDGTAKTHPQQVVGYGHGVLFLGSEGWVHVNRGRIDANPKSLLKAKIPASGVHLLKSDNHQANLIDAIKGRTRAAAPIDIAFHSDTLCNLNHIATKLRRKLHWDPVQETFVNDSEANAMLDRPMRGPWKV